MRILIIITLLLGLCYKASSADIFCPMDLSDEEHLEFMEYRAAIKDKFSAQPLGDGAFYVPLKIHLMGTNDGQGFLPLTALFDQLCALNTQFIEADFKFYVVPDIEFHNNSNFINLSPTGWGSGTAQTKLAEMMGVYFQDTAVNIYFTQGTGLCGLAPFPSFAPSYGGRTGILMENNCANTVSKKTLPHEMGHHFDLLHTFQGHTSNSPLFHEYVSRTEGIKNCQSAGDGFCDTPADYQNQACPYVPDPNKKDLRGDIYLPDPSLFMSYYGDNCVSRFSGEEINHMRNVINTVNSRKVYLQRVAPDVSAAANTAHVLPALNEELPHSIPYEFTWEDSGADAYLFIVYLASTVRYETIVTGTSAFYTPDLADVNRTLRWRVKPIRWGNLCSDFSSYRNFKVTGATPLFDLAATSMKIFPNPVSKGTIRIELNNGLPLGDNPVVSIYNHLGVELMSLSNSQFSFQGSATLQLALPDLSSGMYFLGIRGNSASYISKLFIQ
jgi:hypothetical protein